MKLLSLPLLLIGLFAALSYSETTRDEANTISVYERASRSVVHIKTRQTPSSLRFRDSAAVGGGTGFVLDEAGHVVTNYHVVADSSELVVALGSGGEDWPATLVGTAPVLDLAVLKLVRPASTSEEIVPITLGDSSLIKVGQKVMAIGNALGLQGSLTVGVISGLARDLPGAPLALGHAFIQTDAAVNPGNSGGPLLDSEGKVVGINTVVAREGQNISFAIPINLLKQVLPDLIKMGHVYQPSLGLSAIPITPGIANLFGLPVTSGLLVQEVAPRSAAFDGDLRGGTRLVPMNETVYALDGDIVTEVNGKPAESAGTLTTAIMTSKPGDRITLTIVRQGVTTKKYLLLPPMHLR